MTKAPRTKVILSMGSGGVGKTTLSAATACKAALEGKRVVVMTIDPSARLKDLLGLSGDGQLTQVQWPELEGRLWGLVLDSRGIFDDFIRKAAEHTAAAEKLLNNRLYQELSTSLSGSQEFTSLEKLRELVMSDEYDLVVVDTPPADHAIEFLTAPDRLAALFDEGVASWFRTPLSQQGFLKRIIRKGANQVLRALELLTGAEFIRELSDFFNSLSGWQGRLRDRLMETKSILHGENCDFQVVCTSEPAQISQASKLINGLTDEGIQTAHILVNRCYPHWIETVQNESLPPGLKRWRDDIQSQIQSRDVLMNKSFATQKLVKIPHFGFEPNPIQLAKFLQAQEKLGVKK